MYLLQDKESHQEFGSLLNYEFKNENNEIQKPNELMVILPLLLDRCSMRFRGTI